MPVPVNKAKYIFSKDCFVYGNRKFLCTMGGGFHFVFIYVYVIYLHCKYLKIIIFYAYIIIFLMLKINIILYKGGFKYGHKKL